MAKKEKLDEVSDLIDTINNSKQFRAKEITKCPDCGQWKIPRYDVGTNRVTTKHVCPGRSADPSGQQEER